MEEVLKNFDNNYIKYFTVNPIIFHDENLGRKFTEKYGLKKWATPGDMAGYRSNESYNCNVGNWRGYNIDHIRLAKNMTYNKDFFTGLSTGLNFNYKNYLISNIILLAKLKRLSFSCPLKS